MLAGFRGGTIKFPLVSVRGKVYDVQSDTLCIQNGKGDGVRVFCEPATTVVTRSYEQHSVIVRSFAF